MNAELGVYLLLIAFVASVYASVASLLAQKNNDSALALSARNALLLTWPLLTGATLLLTLLLLNGAFGTEFVWSVTDTTMPTYLKATALWGGQAGSLLFWTWLLSSFLCGAVVINWKRENELMPIVINVSALTVGFFLLLVTFWENPFAQFWQTPSGDVVAALFGPSALLAGISRGLANLGEALPTMIGIIFGGIVDIAPPAGSFALNPGDGQGLNPLLRHPGMIIHPPLLYLGFVGFTVPFAFGVSALVNNRASEDNWMNTTRRWTLVAWLFLSFGLILGGWWAYDVLGWGGYWAWDPV
ncbi:MAG: cytochrome c biogenesis protein CcsA, partial [Anaerolineae bacterium]